MLTPFVLGCDEQTVLVLITLLQFWTRVHRLGWRLIIDPINEGSDFQIRIPIPMHDVEYIPIDQLTF